ncbi:MAG: DnaJ domain-containing protein, partial [Oscillochloris sp.]|nr:DnaJ domain-containing protein [Oscillochloris sp.]
MEDFEKLDYYELLGLSRDASSGEIKRAYRREIGRFHPDRYTAAGPAEQEYASRRAQQINEAYRVLSNLSLRSAYDRGHQTNAAPISSGPTRRSAPPPPSQPRDHLAELYDQAVAHMQAGRAIQAAATLRELLRLSPFYRDAAALLDQAEAAARPIPPAQSQFNRRHLMIGAVGGLALLGAGAIGWMLRRDQADTAIGSTLPPATTIPLSPTVAPAIAGVAVTTTAPPTA